MNRLKGISPEIKALLVELVASMHVWGRRR